MIANLYFRTPDGGRTLGMVASVDDPPPPSLYEADGSRTYTLERCVFLGQEPTALYVSLV